MSPQQVERAEAVLFSIREAIATHGPSSSQVGGWWTVEGMAGGGGALGGDASGRGSEEGGW